MIKRVKQSALILVLLLVFSILVPTDYAESGEGDGYVPDEIVLHLDPAADVSQVAASHGLNSSPASIDQFGARPIYRLQILDGAAPPVKAEALLADARVLQAEPNYIGAIPEGVQQSSWVVGGDEGGYMGQWAPEAIRLPEAHLVSRGNGLRVAVLDTGVDASHPALAGHISGGFDFVDFDTDPGEEGTQGVDLGFGHGTHVAGLVALAAPDAEIVPVRILRPDGSGNMWVLVEGLEYAASQSVDVINLSFSFTQDSDILEDVLEDVICDDDDDGLSDQPSPAGDDDDCLPGAEGGIVVVAAAGNRGGTIREYPAAEDEDGILAVAASTQANQLAAFSTRGPWVHLAAPGEQVLSTVPGDAYGSWSGTSMAAPLAAGTAALVRGAFPQLGPEAVVRQMVTSSAPLDDLQLTRRVDAAAAVGFSGAGTFRLMLPLVRR